jgi:hypothetical protein
VFQDAHLFLEWVHSQEVFSAQLPCILTFKHPLVQLAYDSDDSGTRPLQNLGHLAENTTALPTPLQLP